jgi:hypothetical protein
MTRLTSAVAGLTLFLFVCSCASQKTAEKLPTPKFQGTVLAKDVDESGAIGAPRSPTTEFSYEDRQVAALLTLENVSGTHKIRWEWVEPGGQVYLATDNVPVYVAKGKYLPTLTAWHRISLRDDPAARISGEWTVRIFVDDELIDTKPFRVKGFTDTLMLPENAVTRPFPKDWGLIIGVEDYQRLPKVEFARKDALIVRDYFMRVLGVPEENIISLIDSEATKAHIEGYIKKYIPSNVGKDATLYVYFAGHGMPGIKEGEPYLVPYDADTRFIEQTGYKLMSFYQDLNRLKLHRVYVFLDSCFSGMASRAAEMLIKEARPALFRVNSVRPPSRSIISFNATSTGQISNAFPAKEHGLFTYFLLLGMKGEADANDDGWISVKETYKYVLSNVSRESRRLQSEQTPVILPAPDQIKDIGLTRSMEQNKNRP